MLQIISLPLKNMPRTRDDLSPARFFLQRQERIPLLPGPVCKKDEIGSGFQQQ